MSMTKPERAAAIAEHIALSEHVAAIVAIFEKANGFSNCIDALGDVAPNQWQKQLLKASAQLSDAIHDAYTDCTDALHDGEFVEYETPKSV